MKDINYSVEIAKALLPQEAAATTLTSSAIDRMGFDDGRLVFQTGAATGTPDSQSHVCKVQECATSGGSYADVSGATLTITADSTTADVKIPDMHKRLRYFKVVATTTFVNGTAPKNKFMALLELGRKYTEPVA